MGSFLDKPMTEKESHVGDGELDGRKLAYAMSCMQGWRICMEDSHIYRIGFGNKPDVAAFGVFDGHGGNMVALHIQDHLIDEVVQAPAFQSLGECGSKQCATVLGEVVRKSFLSLDEKIRNLEAVSSGQDHSGSTGVMMLVTPTHYIAANCGDSRLILCSKNGVRFTTVDHKPTNPSEQARIENAGGSVSFKRVGGDLAVSRAFGDFVYKMNKALPAEEQMVSVEPEISILERDFDEDQFIVVACDGIWDVMSNTDVCDFVRGKMDAGYSLDYICEMLLDHCLRLESRDNMSVIIVALPGAPSSIGTVPRPEAMESS